MRASINAFYYLRNTSIISIHSEQISENYIMHIGMEVKKKFHHWVL